MADPVTLGVGIAGLGATALGAVQGAQGAQFSGAAQSAQFNYQAGVAQVNSTIAKQDAEYASYAGEVTAQQAGLRTRQEVGATRAGFGAGNIGIGPGSTGKVLASETEVGQQNQNIIRANAAKTAYGFDVKAAQDVAQAGAFRTAAGTAGVAGELGATASILGGVSSVSSKWLQGQQSGIWDA